MSIKGFPSQKKTERVGNEFATVSPINQSRLGLDVSSHIAGYTVATDAVEAGSTVSVINATAHLALKGDVIRVTSGDQRYREVVVHSITTNAITLAEDLDAALATGVTFGIVRMMTPLCDADGALTISGNISASFSEEATVADGGVLPAKVKVVGGYDGSNVQVLKTDASGELQIDVLSSALPSGAATSAKQDTEIASLSSIDTKLSSQATAANQSTANTALAAIQTAVQLLDDGTATAGSAITSKGMAAVGSDGTNARILKTDTAGELQVDVVSVAPSTGRDMRAKATIDYSSTNVTSGAYVELISTVGSSEVGSIEIFDSSGETLILALGGSGSESEKLYIVPGGNGLIPLRIPGNSRVAVKALSTTASVGRLLVNFYS